MNQSIDYKKLFLNLLLIAIFFFSFSFLSFAQTADEIRAKIEEKNGDIAQIEAEIQAYQAELSVIGKQKNTLSSLIKELDLTRKKLTADINLTQSKIDKTNLKIQSLGSEIGDKEDIISNHKDALIINIKKIYEVEQDSLTETLLQYESLSSLWNDIDHMASIREAIISKINDLKEIKGELQDTRSETISAKNELIALKSKVLDQKKIVEQNASEKNKLLKQTKNNEANYQKLLKAQEAEKDALERELRDYESQLKFIIDPNKLPNGGVLSWPLDYVYITQLFGKTVDAKRLYASGSHSGVDFRASVGTPVRAMSDGVVMGAGDTDATCPKASFGKWMLIKYNNGLSSAYGHLSLNKAVAGQKVSRGDIVAYSGNTGHTTGPHLHVTIYISDAVEVKTIPSKSCNGKTLTQPIAALNAYLDPMFYLPPYKK